MKKIEKCIQEAINERKDINGVRDELTGWGLERDVEFIFEFKGKYYIFQLVDSGKSDEPQYGTYSEIEFLKEI